MWAKHAQVVPGWLSGHSLRMQGDSIRGKNRSALIGHCSAIGLKVGRTGGLATSKSTNGGSQRRLRAELERARGRRR